MRILQPPGWPPPRGYANGIAAEGRLVFVAGQVGWDETGAFPAADLAGQAAQALRNIRAVLAEAGAGPEHVVRLTWYVVDMDEYRSSRRALGAVWREVMGAHYPAMTLVAVAGLAEAAARVEIEATAVVPVPSAG
jgi:enamine deaminase RidA (YjgF/YER057c/UK114 family)